jgi:predicted metal-dependent phosphotriesterase family hydrolase
VLPLLLESGVSQAQIDQMARANPRAIFERAEPY